MYSPQTSSLSTHSRTAKAPSMFPTSSRSSEHTDRKAPDVAEAHVFTIDHQMALPSSSSEKQPATPKEKEKSVTATPGRRHVVYKAGSVVSPSHSLESPQSLFLSPLPAPHQYMSTSQGLPTKDLENGNNSGATGEGADEEDKKQRESHKKRSKNWTRPESLQLIRLRTQLEPRFAKSGRKTELWDEIAEALQKENFTRDAQQCRDKWEKLTAGYKEVRDGIKDKEDNPFYDDLHSLLSGKSVKRDREKERDELPVRELRKGSAHDTALAMKDEKMEPLQKSSETHDEDLDEGADEPARKRKKPEPQFMSVTDMEAVQRVVETVITRQQNFFRELLDAMERKEQMREQMRQEKEDKWRAEERAQRGVFNNAMIILTQKLVGEQIGASLAMAPSATTPTVQSESPPPLIVNSPEGPQGAPKRRSKNWKRAEVLQLIKLRGEMDSRFAHSTRRAALWDELAERLLVQGIKRDGKQCREKWDKLMAEYKDVTDGKRDQRESPYYAELTAILGRPVEAP
ncbi:trihelix transcription factor PTL [Physcomitrium patens]|uniref:Myb-like domain-containing protein n=1 Tax=Physcomitrium patens TaxID=3218 RepID=A0A2K1JDU2_PHYPA|nr:trihelix transcription factor GTL1-like [Physcomitrium patens]PNR39690.1 hypothetical protein PHYPA_019969 [Physcomitrium patens]|eukprot:XP_024395857.1 trihelix transcription factor GTL1-like [Physcomitrella patens]